MTSTKKAIVAAIFVAFAVVLSLFYNVVYPIRSFEYDILIFYGFLASMAFILVLVFQRFIDTPRIHLPLSLGWGMVFIAGIEKFNAEYLDTIDPIWWSGLNEDIFTSMI